MHTWIVYNSLFAIALAVFLKIASRSRFFQRLPNLLLLGWMLVLIKLVTPPLIPLPLFDAVERVLFFADNGAVKRAELALDAPLVQTSEFLEISEDQPASNPASLEIASVDATPTTLAVRPSTSVSNEALLVRSNVIPSLTNVAIAGWLIGFFLLLALRYKHYVSLGRIMACGTPSEILTSRLEQLRAPGGSPGVVEVDANLSPSLVGLWTPKILLPSWANRQLSSGELDAVLLHEFEHYRRRDLWLEQIAWLGAAAFWWNPCGWWAYRELRSAQELCCDAAVINRGLHAKPYALTLWRVLELLQQEGSRKQLAMGGVSILPQWSSTQLEQRLRSLGVKNREDRCSTWLLAVGIALMLALLSYPTLAEYQRLPHSFRYQPLAELTDVSAMKELPMAWPPQAQREAILKEIPNAEIVAQGHFDFGLAEHPLLLAIVREKSKSTSNENESIQLAIDINRDQILSPSELFSSRSDSPNQWIVGVATRLPVDDESSAPTKETNRSSLGEMLNLPMQGAQTVLPAEYQLLVKWENERFQVAHAAQLQGKAICGGETYRAILIDRNCNGHWTDADDRLLIDWDGDGTFSPLRERYSCQQEIKRSDTRYALAFGTDTLELEPIQGGGSLTLHLPLQDPKLPIEQFQAVLVSNSGVHLTINEVDRPVEVPVGVYTMKQLRFRVVSDQIWRFAFEPLGGGGEKSQAVVDNGSDVRFDVLGKIKLTASLSAGTLENTATQEGDANGGVTVVVAQRSSEMVVQPMLRTETGMYLAASALGKHSPTNDNPLVATRTDFGLGLKKKTSLVKTTGFGCGAFCPIPFGPDSTQRSSSLIRMQFDSGPIAGKLTAQLGTVPAGEDASE